ncbi:MAG: hypothetical protein KIT80_16140 [Chitinophagaceae bacterium]|nr:hypothetical protein [Chitinophagaceae bacterium]MCW5928447.1 hypothetical protein [Chitinophagaceae bacterium]
MVLKLTNGQLQELAGIQERNHKVQLTKELDEMFRLCLIGMGNNYRAGDAEGLYAALLEAKAILDIMFSQPKIMPLGTEEPADLS